MPDFALTTRKAVLRRAITNRRGRSAYGRGAGIVNFNQGDAGHTSHAADETV